MQTLIYSTPYTDDKLDLRRLVGKDLNLTDAEATEKSAYVLFPPGSVLAPATFRAQGRTEISVTDEIAEELLSHPLWRFRTQADHDAHDARTRKRAADQLGPIVADRIAAGLAVGVISPAILTGGDEPATAPEVAEASPADPAAVMAAAKAQAQADREAEKKSQAADKDAKQ